MPNVTEIHYPPANFYFRFNLLPSGGQPAGNPTDASFQEVSGIKAEMETEPYREGGRSEFPHRLPVGTKFQNLVLKRGLVCQSSEVFKWCVDTLGNGTRPVMSIVPGDVSVDLLCVNEESPATVLKSWAFTRAWPVKWEISNLNSMGNEVLIETLELTYDRFTVK